jgi:hypothetical protein
MEKSHRGGRKESPAAHPGGGMPYFNRDHWEKKAPDVETAGGRYSSEFNQLEEYTASVDKTAGYVKGHRAQH